jgi:hypothetical protein
MKCSPWRTIALHVDIYFSSCMLWPCKPWSSPTQWVQSNASVLLSIRFRTCLWLEKKMKDLSPSIAKIPSTNFAQIKIFCMDSHSVYLSDSQPDNSGLLRILKRDRNMHIIDAFEASTVLLIPVRPGTGTLYIRQRGWWGAYSRPADAYCDMYESTRYLDLSSILILENPFESKAPGCFQEPT